MYRSEEDTALTDLFLPCSFICHVNYIKKANNTATKYLENNITKHDITKYLIFWTPQKSLGA